MTMENTKARVKIGNKLSNAFTFNTGVKQGDGLSTILFNLALHQAVNKINQKRTIYFKSSQICAYADDIVIVTRNISTLKQIYLELEKEAERTLKTGEENALRCFERKILRRIFGPVQDTNGWRIRYNQELDRLIEGQDIVRFIKAQRLRWLGHVE
jgi:hypothetical protein